MIDSALLDLLDIKVLTTIEDKLLGLMDGKAVYVKMEQ